MKSIIRLFAIGIAGFLTLGVFNASADLEVSASVQINATADFYEPLTPAGTWVEVGTYGRCWRPASVAVGWRPYCDGTWVWTDCGWYWESAEPWAWACYHYGSWTYETSYGWVWVPGIEWAPAWVYWRTGGGHIGWAPCPPHGVVVVPTAFVFVEDRHFRDHHRPSTVIINNTTIINKTTQIAEVKREERNIGGSKRKVVVNEGPGVALVEKATGKKETVVAIQEAEKRTVVPPTVKRRASESPAKEAGKDTPPGRDQPKRDNDKPVLPNNPARPDKTVVPDKPITPDKPDKGVVPDKPKSPDKVLPREGVVPPNQDRRPPREEITPSPRLPKPEGPGEGRRSGPDNSRGSDKGDKEKDKPDKP